MSSPTHPSQFRVVLTADFFNTDGSTRFPDIGLNVLEGHPHIAISRFAQHHNVIGPDQLADANGVIVLAPRLTRESLHGKDNLLAIGRFGVGFDSVDVPACTDADVALFITPGAVDRSVAEATVCWMLALSHHVKAKDHLLRTGQWHERTQFLGSELRDRTLGIVGFGRIGRALVQLLRAFGMNRILAFDPYARLAPSETADVALVPLPQLLAESDFVSVHCLLNDETRNLIGAPELSLMKPTAYLINTARGGIIDEDALFDALKNRRIAGAAIDCFVGEPILAPHRFGELDNVLLAPHSIAWTTEMFRDIGRMVCQGMLDISLGNVPSGMVNPEVLEKPSFQAKWKRIRKGP